TGNAWPSVDVGVQKFVQRLAGEPSHILAGEAMRLAGAAIVIVVHDADRAMHEDQRIEVGLISQQRDGDWELIESHTYLPWGMYLPRQVPALQLSPMLFVSRRNPSCRRLKRGLSFW